MTKAKTPSVKGVKPAPVPKATKRERESVERKATADNPELVDQSTPEDIGAKALDTRDQGVNEDTRPELAQHPDNVAVEVAKRSADNVEPVEGSTGPEDEAPDETVVHRKVFVVLDQHVDFRAYDHTANINATRQEMINKGLRPVGDVTHVGTSPHGDGESVDLTYEGKAIPAYAASEPDVVHAHVHQGETPATPRGVVETESN